VTWSACLYVQVTLRLLSRDTVNYAGDLLRQLKGRVELVRASAYPGKGSPSSGWIGIWFLIQFCDTVSVFGMGDSIAPVDGGVRGNVLEAFRCRA
jgi:hypothetical protein